MILRNPIPLLVSSLAVVVLAGCGGSNGDGGNASNTRNTTTFPFIAKSDVRYIDAIVPHHDHAVEMADREIAVGSSAGVKALAQRIKDDQTAELALLASARRALTGQAATPAPVKD